MLIASIIGLPLQRQRGFVHRAAVPRREEDPFGVLSSLTCARPTRVVELLVYIKFDNHDNVDTARDILTENLSADAFYGSYLLREATI
jgi:hypothetical protein